MLIKTKYIDCASKSVFNTWKLPTSAADTSGDIYWSAIVCIQDTGEVWTHGKLYGGFFSNADSNKVSLTIGGTTKILALDGHVQSYTTLTGSGTTADQAILSTGVANKWTLKTLGKNAFSNVDYLPADATAVAAEKVVNAMRFQYNGKDMHSFDGSVARLLNIIQGDNVFITGDSQGNVTIAADPGSDTVNTAGATNLIDKKLFLIGAESQTTSPQTYSNQYVYIGTDNCLYSLGKKVLTEHQAIYNLDLQTQVGDAVTKVTTFDPNAANNSFTLVQGTNVTLIPDATNKKVTISSKDTTYDFYNLIFKQGDTVVDTYKPTTSPNKSFKAGTNVTFTKSGDEITVTTQDTRNTAGATEKLATKLFLTGSLTQTDNPQTYTNSKVYIGTDNKLYSDGKVVSTGDHTHNYAGATSPGGPALKVDLNPSGLLAATYGSYGGILQDSNNGPVAGSWSNRIKILHNNASGYYTELAQAFTGTAGLWHRRNVAGVVSDWTPVIDKANFRTYLDATYVIRGNDPNVLTNYVRYSIASGLTMNWEAGNATPTHIWGAKNSDSSKAYVFNGNNIRAFANAVNRAGDTMTGTLKVTEIQATNGNGLVMWNGTTYTYLGMQAGTTYIRSGKTDLQHRYNGTDYKIWDARNLVGLRTEHSHNTINFIDSRDVASTPQEHGAGVWLDFKANAKANLTDGGSYTGLLTVRKYGGVTDWAGGKSAQLGFTDNSNLWVRFGTGTAWEAWQKVWTSTSLTGVQTGHTHNFYDLANIVVASNEFNFIPDGYSRGNILLNHLPMKNRTALATPITLYHIKNGASGYASIQASSFIKNGSSDSYILLGGGGQKKLNHFVYASGNLGVQEATGSSDNIGRAQFWGDNTLGAYGVTLCHSNSAGYKTKIYHDYGSGGNLYMKACSNGTWGSVHTLWNSGNFDPNTKVNKAGDTMTGNLKMTETTNIILRIANTSHTSGIGYDTNGNECIALWAKNTATRLRWYAGKDMSNMTAGSMMGITPDFEISKASGSAIGYIGGNSIWHSGNSNLTSVAWNVKEVTFGTTNFPKDGGPRANISPYSLKVWDSYGQVVAGSSRYGVVLEIMGRAAHWDNQLYFESYGHNIWHRASSYNDSSWSYTWAKIAMTSDLSNYLPLTGGTMSSGARISHNGNLYIGSASNSGWVGVQNICSQSSLGDTYWSIRINGNAIFQSVKKSGSSDSYVLLGGGGHKALSDLGGTHTHTQYVAKSGDTMSGALTMSPNTKGIFLRSASSRNSGIGYDTNGNECMAFGTQNANTKFKFKTGYDWSAFAGGGSFTNMTNADLEIGNRYCKINGYTVYHTGNLSLNNYVKKSGDTMTGNLQVGQVVIGNTNKINTTASGSRLYLGYRDTPNGVNICYNNAPLTYGSAQYTIYHAGNIGSVLNKRRVPGEMVDFYVYSVNGYTCTSTDYTTFRNQLFDSSGRGKSSVSYKATFSSLTYTVNLSDFILAYNGISAYSNGMYTAGGGEIESNRIGSTAGANSKTISGLEMPKHAHWFGHYRSDNANDRDVFGPDGNQNWSTNGTNAAGQGGNWRTGYSGSGSSKDWRPKTIFVFKMIYAPQSW